MRRILSTVMLLLALGAAAAGARPAFDEKSGVLHNAQWDAGVPLGGLGCGAVELLPDGWFRAASPMLRSATGPALLPGSFFAVRVDDGNRAVARVLRLLREAGGDDASHVPSVDCVSLYPRIRLDFDDPALPVHATASAVSFIIPHDLPASTLPAAFFEVALANPGSATCAVTLVFSWQPPVGVSGRARAWAAGDLSGVVSDSTPAWLIASPTSTGRIEVGAWSGGGADFWPEFAATGAIPGATRGACLLLGTRFSIPPTQQRTVPFILAWERPTVANLVAPTGGRGLSAGAQVVSVSAEGAALVVARRLGALQPAASAWSDLVLRSNLPSWFRLQLLASAGSAARSTLVDNGLRLHELAATETGQTITGDAHALLAGGAFVRTMFPRMRQETLEAMGDGARARPSADGRMPRAALQLDGVGMSARLVEPATGAGGPEDSAAWVIQTVGSWRATGDKDFLRRAWPAIRTAMSALVSMDTDADSLPEGASRFAPERSAGTHLHNLMLFLAALRAAESAAIGLGEPVYAGLYHSKFAAAMRGMDTNFFVGDYYISWADTLNGQFDPNSFAFMPAGDWSAREFVHRPLYENDVARVLFLDLARRHLSPYWPLPPLEISPDGAMARRECAPMALDSFLAAEAFRIGMPAWGMEIARRGFVSDWQLLQHPGARPYCYIAPEGRGGADGALGDSAVWNTLPALAGVTLDAVSGELALAPRLWRGMSELHVPVFLPAAWLWLDFAPEKEMLSIRVERVFADVLIASLRIGEATAPVRLSPPFRLAEGAVFDAWPHALAAGLPMTATESIVAITATQRLRPGLNASGWRAIASIPEDASVSVRLCRAAFDGDAATAWTTYRAALPGDWFELDLGAEYVLERADLINPAAAGNAPGELPRGLRVEASASGETWSTVLEVSAAECASASGSGILPLPLDGVRARRLRLFQQGSAAGRAWSIGEMNVYGAPIAGN